MTEVKLNDIFTQLSLRKIAYFSSSVLGNDIYFLREYIDVMINVIGEEKLIEMLLKDDSPNSKKNKEIGENWYKNKGMKKMLRNFDRIIEETKSAYDFVEDKTLKKRDVNFSRFSSKAKKIPMIKPEIYALFVFLVKNTSINRMTIPPEYYRIVEHVGYRSLGDLKKKRSVGDGSSHIK